MRLSPLGDSAIVLALGDAVDEAVLARVRAVAGAIQRRRPAGVVDVVPAFASVTVIYDIAHTGSYTRLCADLAVMAEAADNAMLPPTRRVEIPVCYGGAYGPDLDEVAAGVRRSAAAVVALHSGARYRVHAIGFAPGFAYLGGLPEAIHTPRRVTPRRQVPAGSVGIGGEQTGIYPLGTPGGWNLIGRTPLRLFDPARAEPAMLRAGDEVAFREIDPDEFAARAAAENPPPMPAPKAPACGMGDAVEIEVLKAGMHTTLQDLGRSGHRAEGVPLSGGADRFALRLANLLVGNCEHASALELTLRGPDLRFSHDALVTLTGAEFDGLPRYRPVRVAAGRTLSLGTARNGCRAYLAVAGGFEVAPVLGSGSTYVRAGLGGHHGRALRDGDRLMAPRTPRAIDGRWRIDERILPAYSAEPIVRVVRGAQAEEFSEAFFVAECRYRVTPHSDRMGLRLGGAALERRPAEELRSSVVLPGTIQVPPDGQPIVLLADAQTLGGYPQIAHVISVDLPLVAQLRPGDVVRFRAVSLEEAHQLALARDRALGMLREGLAQKFS